MVKQSSDFAARVFASLIYVLRTRYALRASGTAWLFMGFAHVIHDAFSIPRPEGSIYFLPTAAKSKQKGPSSSQFSIPVRLDSSWS
ncbi:hypothetical protein [Paraglaciecola chathamensis]|uniref:hypothetical protein n=1 Tax=Paraglaciecola chathamensis TaxID=368405 RepID=UPI002706AF6B|nr:hypothetical protein [Paraglaciecola chathamensis]MDO6560938.1 hypothetical protein [Paraglaciecola chathamensis]